MGLSIRRAKWLRRGAVAVPLLAVAAVIAVRAGPGSGRGGIVTRGSDGTLRLRDARYRFIGVNVYSLASSSEGPTGFTCGRDWSDDDVRTLLDEVAAMGCNAIRIDAYQSFTSGGRDFSRIDLILREAGARDIRVILTLENHWDDCTQGGVKDESWYREGYLRPYGSYTRSYREYARGIVRRYRDSPHVLMWQLMNEAESGRGSAFPDPTAIHAFATDMSSVVRAEDGRHLLSLGTGGVNAPGSGGFYYALHHAIEGIDIVEAHDYHDERSPYPADIAAARAVARLLRKPFFVGEVGIRSPPFGRPERARLVTAKLEALWEADIDGVLVWSYRAGDGVGNDFDRTDPLYEAIRAFAGVRTDEAGGGP